MTAGRSPRLCRCTGRKTALRPFGSPGTRFGAKNPNVSGCVQKDNFSSERSLQTATEGGVLWYSAFGSNRDRQIAAVFFSFLPFVSFLSLFLSGPFCLLSRERPLSRCDAAGAAGEECLEELRDRDPTRAPSVEPRREGERDGERLLRLPDPFVRWE